MRFLRKLGRDRSDAPPAQETAKTRYGRGLRPGDRHYRAWVGPPKDYDLMGANQVSLLFAAGLRETHRLVDVGCGSLRAGRLLIPYLRPGHYFGVEPDREMVGEGIERELGRDILAVKHPKFRHVENFALSDFGVEFDYALAQSVFSHTYPDLTRLGLGNISEALAEGGKLFATFKEGEGRGDGSGWVYPDVVAYRWQEIEEMLRETGLVGRRLDWPHPRQHWFVAARPPAEKEIDDLARRLRPPLAEA